MMNRHEFKDKHMSKLIPIDEDETVNLMPFQDGLVLSIVDLDPG